MPLQSGQSEEIISHNIAELISAGYSREQAAAISYKNAGKDSVESSRIKDINGWYEVKKNPLSKAGVFPYLGKSIDPTGSLGLDPQRIYQVFRSPEELADPECVASFKLIPWVLGHTMLGPEGSGLTTAENKGVHGVTGEDVFFDGDTLFGNIKWFSDTLENNINADVKELSLGYRCVYEISSGIYDGKPYDVVQRRIRGNHLALVPEGRMGHDVAVLDHMNFTFDAKDIVMADEPEKKPEGEKKEEGKKEMTLAEVTAQLEALVPEVQKLMGFMAKLKPIEEKEHGEKLDGSGADAEEKKDDKKNEKKEGSGMDAAERIKTLENEISSLKGGMTKSLLSEVAKRDELANKLSSFVGVFDHAEKTLGEVAAYGVEKLGIKCDKGQELAVLQGFLHNRSAKPEAGFAFDSKEQGGRDNEIDAYINGKKG